jgi:nucleoside 2-deoxyribosyltransferase
MGWEEKLGRQEQRDWDRWVARVREGTVQQMVESAFVATLVPEDGKTDVKFAVELGLAIMLGKPIVAISVAGRPVPGKLREIADAVIEVSDMDTEAGQADLQAKMLPVIERLTEAGTQD